MQSVALQDGRAIGQCCALRIIEAHVFALRQALRKDMLPQNRKLNMPGIAVWLDDFV